MNKIIRKIKKNARRKRGIEVNPDEIFLDSQNLPDFDTQQFEGTIESPIKLRSIFGVGIIFSIIILLFSGRLWFLQIANGEDYDRLSKANSLEREPIFAPRGNIYDTNGVRLAWNDTKNQDTPWGERKYIETPGFSHVLGYVGYPARDKSGNYWQTEIIGKSGIEKFYNAELSGKNGSHIVERDISGKTQSGALVDDPNPGKNINLTVDSRLQGALHQFLFEAARENGYPAGSAVMMDVKTGAIIAMTSVPEFDSNVMSLGKDRTKIREYLTSSKTPLLNRVVNGLFTPGSIVKPYVALGALTEGVIDPNKLICSCGSISIPNPYFPDQPAVFRDYAKNNGLVDMRKALAVSSNIYFFEVGGGFQGQKGIGITNIDKYLSLFGLDKKTGIDLEDEKFGNLPSPEWKSKKFPGEPWRIGDTYNTAIGQYGVQVTPIEMVRSMGAIATRGMLVEPHLLKDKESISEKITDIPDKHYTVVHEGMRQGAMTGTGQLGELNFAVATKTGTAQVGYGNNSTNVWLTGFFPYENPRYSFVIMMEHGPENGHGAAATGKKFLSWLSVNAPEYTKN